MRRREHRRDRTGSAPSSACRPGPCQPDPAPPPGALPARVRPVDRRGDPVLEDHRGPLRARPARRAGPHGRQEDRTHPRRRRLARLTAARWAPPGPQREPGSATTTCTPWSMTTPGWPTPRSCPTRRASTCAAFLLRAVGLLRRPWHRPHRAGHDRQPLQLQATPRPWPTPSRSSAPSTSSSEPHCPWQNGKVERFNRTLQVEWAYRQVFLSNDDRAAALAPWLEHYNTRRRHTALGRTSADQPTVTNLMAEYS